MEKIKTLKQIVLGCLFLLTAWNGQAQNTVTGQVSNTEGAPLIGANIRIQGTNDGAVTDLDGQFTLSSVTNFPWRLAISYTGFTDKSVEITRATNDLKVELTEGIITDAVVISASRKAEKVQDAPASVSVLTARKIEASAQAMDPTRNLINLAGVQIQQQGASRTNISLRGASNLTGTSALILADYRPITKSGGVYKSDGSGIEAIDLARIEVVRGPGSALWGPGVSSGVVHFISKNPIDYPGTTVELIGGELNTFGATVRHAGRNTNKTFGYKINAHYKRGDEFTLDPVEDAEFLQTFQNMAVLPVITNGVPDATLPGTVIIENLDEDGDGNPMQDYFENSSANLTLEFRPQDDLSIFASGGLNRTSAFRYSNTGVELNQAMEFWGQARLQKGGFFAQVAIKDNDSGDYENFPTFGYQTGQIGGTATVGFDAQTQYNFSVTALNADFTVGLDYKQLTTDSRNLLFGRNEADDDFRSFGGYAQGKFGLGDKIDVVLAGRYDTYNILEENTFDPRIGLVYKINPKHTLRATYNKTHTAPGQVIVNVDGPVRSIVPGLFDVWLHGVKEVHQWADNPVIDVTVPNVPDLPFGTPGLPLSIPYALTVERVLAGVLPNLPQNPQLIAVLTDYFADPANAPRGFTGTFNPYNILTRAPMTNLATTEKAQATTIDSYEIGYKGLIADKLSVSADIYTIKRNGFIALAAVSPAIALVGADIGNDLGNAVSADLIEFLQTNTQLPAPAINNIANVIGGGFNQAGQAVDAQLAPLYPIFGAVETNLVPQGDGVVHVPAGFVSNPDAAYDYWGMDIGLEYYINNDLSVFGNYSYQSQTQWIPGEPDDDGLDFPFSLNTPKNKFRLGANYVSDTGWRGNVAFQHDDAFFADLGLFRGETPAKNLVDVGIGRKFGNDLSVDVSATNLLNTEYRAFANFPKIGRRALVKLTYTFGEEE